MFSTNQIKCWFLVRGENRSTRGKTSHSRLENQPTQSTFDAECENRTRATSVEGKCSHHNANPATSYWTAPYSHTHANKNAVATRTHCGPIFYPRLCSGVCSCRPCWSWWITTLGGSPFWSPYLQFACSVGALWVTVAYFVKTEYSRSPCDAVSPNSQQQFCGSWPC